MLDEGLPNLSQFAPQIRSLDGTLMGIMTTVFFESGADLASRSNSGQQGKTYLAPRDSSSLGDAKKAEILEDYRRSI